MKYLHVLTPNSVHPQNIIKFINKNFDKEDHTFLVLADENYVLKNNPRLYAFDNVIFSPVINKTKFSRFKRMVFMMRLFSEYDNIIWHSFYGLMGLQMLFAVFQYRYKITWIEYGNDLYYWKQKSKKWIEMFLYEKICKECKYFGTSLEYNQIYYNEKFNKRTKTFFLPTPLNEETVNYLKDYCCDIYNHDKKSIQVMIGADGNRYNQHCKIVNLLKKYSANKISFYIPIKYYMLYEYKLLVASKGYISDLIEYSKRVLKNPVIGLQKSNLDRDSYFRILNNIDIGVFYSDRPIYIDLLLYLLYLEKKIYLPKSSIIFNELKHKGYKIYDTQSISNINWQEFISKNDLSENKKLVEEYMSNDYLKKYWEIYFNYLEKEKLRLWKR